MKARTRHEISLYIGGVHAGDDGVVLKTLLGSCVAVCLFDPTAKVGGMNHYALPRGSGDDGERPSTRFGVHAMELLMRAMRERGAAPHRLVAKVFGGSRVLEIGESAGDVARRNIEFAHHVLDAEGIGIVAEDVGGRHARQIRFHTDSGRVFVKAIRPPELSAYLADEPRRIRHG
jgi:chemotaxis receptor (MCP) glutamine deamidase CheD